MKTYEEIVGLFESANTVFLSTDQGLFQNGVSEHTLCGALTLHIDNIDAFPRRLLRYYGTEITKKKWRKKGEDIGKEWYNV